jgi:hypothetical protein
MTSALSSYTVYKKNKFPLGKHHFDKLTNKVKECNIKFKLKICEHPNNNRNIPFFP